jgi:AcrR family transcriptional regulator
MEHNPRTQAERSAGTRATLVAAARWLWAQRGYAAVGTPEIATAAGVTRGAMYHQFADKADLFAAVLETVEAEVTQRLADVVVAAGVTDPAGALRAAVDAWLDASQDPEVRQIVLLDGPVVLGWIGFRDVAMRHGLGLTVGLLQAAMDAGQLAPSPVLPLAHVLIGALDEAALYAALSEDGAAARAEAGVAVHAVLDGLLTSPAEAGEAAPP